MTEHRPDHDVTDQHHADHDRSGGRRPPARPRWEWWLLLAIAAAVLVFLGMQLFMGGHGPMNHGPGMNHGMPVNGTTP